MTAIAPLCYPPAVSVDLDEAKAAFEAGRIDEAEALLRAAGPAGSAKAAADLGGVCVHKGELAEGVRHLLKALELSPGWVLPRYNLALALLAQGAYELGWMLLEARRGIPALAAPSPELAVPEWRGQNPAGRKLLVIGEQGAGDQIMFARYVEALRGRGAEAVLLCIPEVAPLFSFAVEGLSRQAPADFWAPLMSLPYRLGPDLGIPPPAGIDVPLRSGGGVGVVAIGSPTHANDRNRSLFGADAERLRALGLDLAPEKTGARTFRDTAEIIAGLDLVISVDTAIAHLAASMGKPTWILIPALGVDWRWGYGRDETAWYPQARLYRQARAGDWGAVLDRIERDLA
ncbi:MAG: hypothetical protein E7812_12675 [Phenylobacterium sp.]|nr:MAG: hypothetical protein E7812_12675 [Phenylobacterium sp.]